MPGKTPEAGTEPQQGPSTTTADELKALEIFQRAQTPYAPQLVAWKRGVQGDNGPLPGGYLTFTVMTKLPGDMLFNLRYSAMPLAEQGEIRRKFLEALRYRRSPFASIW